MDESMGVVGRLGRDERGEVNVSTIAWMVIAALVVFGLAGPFNGLMVDALNFVRDTLGI